ncbi:hypothetical protein CH352_16870 [Leptospira hartskeerlii]|uniref:Calx-beta domain-containing protein n=1 Tax=Leptospira hartskeerlii TaxID=2023177 RepID=A0A2M9XIF9_9LEPT|nr:Calx-beta domain-containing protein [Leptospira hartskeerlii]PJZ27478.1 hypothetical protein CH357_02715 [Leptospira hartskeerlii]PJZ32335.1 hypothetical protein CH352_16870 [Leptospira hartskeerlii]
MNLKKISFRLGFILILSLLNNCVSWPGFTYFFTSTGGEGGSGSFLFFPGQGNSTVANSTGLNVNSAKANGAYNTGKIIDITVTFKEVVVVSGGSPYLSLNNGSQGVFLSGSGTKVLTFRYIVGGSSEDVAELDFLNQNALQLGTSFIQSTTGQNLDITLPNPGAAGSLSANKDLRIDSTPPTVSSATSPNVNNTYGPGANLQISITFSESVVISGIPYIDLNIGKSANFSSLQSGTTALFDFSVSSPDNTSALDYSAVNSLHLGTGGSIVDAAGNAANLALPSPGTSGSVSNSKSISIDTTSPSITNITSSSNNGSYGIGAVISIQAVFDEPVSVSGIPVLLLETGTVDRNASYISGSGSNTLTFEYTVSSGDSSGDLDYVSTNSLTSGNISDLVGNTATLTLANPGASGSLGSNKNIQIDTSSATVSFTQSSISVNETDGTGSVTVGLSSAVPGSITVDYVVTAGTTSGSGTDFTLASGTVTITNPSTSANISFSINDDSLNEPSENFSITLSNPSGVVLGSTTSVTVTILDNDDVPQVEFSGTTGNSTDESNTNRTVTLTLSAASGQSVQVEVVDSGGTATSGTDYTSIGSPLTVTFDPGEISKTITIAVIQDTTYEGNETVSLSLQNPLNATLGTNTSFLFSIIDDEIGIISAETMDADSNGKIDHYKLTFSEAVLDSSFPGYVLNSSGNAQSIWSISGYSNAVLAHGVEAPEPDSTNDSVIYLKFAESAGFDTGAKPDLTTSVTTGLTSMDGSKTVARIFSGSLIESDRAKPKIVLASANAGSTNLTVTFSEATYGDINSPACAGSGDLALTDLTYTNGNASGVTNLASIGSDACASDSGFNAIYLGNVAFISGDDTSDKVAGTTSIFDSANNSGNTVQRPITVTSGPSIVSVTLFDTNKNGNIDQIKITFSENMNDSSVSDTDATRWTFGGTQAVRMDSASGGTGSISSPNDDPGISNDSVITIFTDDSSVTGTQLRTVAYDFASGRLLGNVSSVEVASYADLSSVTIDKAPPVLLTAVASDNSASAFGVDSDDTLVLTFSEDTNKTSATTGTISSIFSLSSSHSWGGLSSSAWDSSGKILTLYFNGSGSSVASGDSISVLGTIADLAGPPNISINIPAVNTISGSFFTDTISPYLLSVVNVTPNSVTISFSESMLMDGSANAANLLSNITLQEATTDACTDPVKSSTTVINSSTIQVNLSTSLCNIDYVVGVSSNVTDIASPFPNSMGSPNSLTFKGNERLKVVSAKSISLYSIKITFSRSPVAGNDATGTAGCTTSTECAKRYKFSPSLGSINSATLGGSLQNEVTITHSSAQTGSAYSVMVANNVDADGFSDTSWGSILDANTLLTAIERQVQASPSDRASFIGMGTSILNFSDGTFFSDPFTDGSVFSFAFNFGGRVYLGTNDLNNAAFRFDPNGSNSVLTKFSFSSGTCSGTDSFGYGTGTTCGTNMGPNGERGVVGFSSATLTISSVNYEILLSGVLKDGVTRGYFTQSNDIILPWTEFGYSATGGANTKSIQTVYAVDNHVYLGLSSAHGTQAPILTHHTVTAPGGIVSVGTGTDMGIRSVSNLGKGGSTDNLKNTSKVVGIDSIIKYNGNLYVANNGGIRYSSDFSGFTSSVLSTPTSFSGTTLVLPPQPSGLEKVNPGKKGITKLLEYNGYLYMARNVAAGSTCTNTDTLQDCQTNLRGELWKCDPTTSGGATTCDPGDWVRIITGTETELGTANAISILQNNGSGVLYVGFDDPTNGVKIFRVNSVNVPSTSGTMTSAGWTQQGTNGLGTVSPLYIRFISSTSISDGYYNYVYVTAGTGSNAIKVFRQVD